MKTKSIFAMLIIALVAITSCSDDDHSVGEAQEAQYEAVSGHWFAELPISGETENWRTEEEGDMTTFDKVTAIFYLGSSLMKDGWWGYLYLQGDNEMVNFGGIDLYKHETLFSYRMNANGNITPSSHIENMPKVTNMVYDCVKDVITADVTYKGQSYHINFTRPDDDEWERLNGYYEILLQEGIVGGYDDGGDRQKTDISDDEADEASRAKTISTTDYTD